MVKQNRLDLSDWVIHFTHPPDSSQLPPTLLVPGIGNFNIPAYHSDPKVNARFWDWAHFDEENENAFISLSYEVILKILEDGHIRSSWSMRSGRSAVYGPRAVCCFTEMPLYALIEYARARNAENVSTCGVAVRRAEFFVAGGRPVISGSTGPYREREPNTDWPRFLHPECGIAEHEQYRYVRCDRKIDWTHEREWRWTDIRDEYACPGLPIWLAEQPISFSEALIFVPMEYQAEKILDKIKELHDAGQHNFGYQYDKSVLARTKVVALDKAFELVDPNKALMMRLEDLYPKMQSFASPLPNEALIARVREALNEAQIAAEDAAESFYKRSSKDANGQILDLCGFSGVILDSSQSPVTSALLQIDAATSYGGIGYHIRVSQNRIIDESVGLAEAAAEAAREVLRSYFPELHFSVRTRLD